MLMRWVARVVHMRDVVVYFLVRLRYFSGVFFSVLGSETGCDTCVFLLYLSTHIPRSLNFGYDRILLHLFDDLSIVYLVVRLYIG
jgi:hypothetical protein